MLNLVQIFFRHFNYMLSDHSISGHHLYHCIILSVYILISQSQFLTLLSQFDRSDGHQLKPLEPRRFCSHEGVQVPSITSTHFFPQFYAPSVYFKFSSFSSVLDVIPFFSLFFLIIYTDRSRWSASFILFSDHHFILIIVMMSRIGTSRFARFPFLCRGSTLFRRSFSEKLWSLPLSLN